MRESRFHRCGVAEDQRRLQRGRRDPRMEREKPLRAARRAAGGASDELVDGGVERQRPRLDFLAQRVPGREAVLTRDRRLRVVQRQIGGGDLVERLARERRAGSAKRRSASGSRAFAASSSDFACFFSCSRFGRAGSSRDGIQPPCFSPVVRRQAARRCRCRSSSSYDGGLGPSREPAGARGAHHHTSPGRRRVSIRCHQHPVSQNPLSMMTVRRSPARAVWGL